MALPDCLPILHYGLTTTHVGSERETRDGAGLSLLALVSKLLMAFALEFDAASGVSLAICANVLRVIGDAGARVRDLPRSSGVSKEGIATALGFLAKRRLALEPFAGEAIWKGLVPYPEGWRASVAKPETLPHYPMVLHRGGYPDGS